VCTSIGDSAIDTWVQGGKEKIDVLVDEHVENTTKKAS